MGSCIGKNRGRELKEEEKQVTISQEEFEIKINHYKSLNREFASNRNKELTNVSLIVSDLTNQNRFLMEYVAFEIERREKFQNLYGVIV